MSVHLGKRYGLQDVLLESDCQLVINRLAKNNYQKKNRLAKNVSNLSKLDVILHEIFSSCAFFKSIV